MFRQLMVAMALLGTTAWACDDPSKHGGWLQGSNFSGQKQLLGARKGPSSAIKVDHNIPSEMQLQQSQQITLTFSERAPYDEAEWKVSASKGLQVVLPAACQQLPASGQMQFELKAEKAGYQYLRINTYSFHDGEKRKSSSFIPILVKSA